MGIYIHAFFCIETVITLHINSRSQFFILVEISSIWDTTACWPQILASYYGATAVLDMLAYNKDIENGRCNQAYIKAK
jgi:hypothetical protein